MKVQKDNNQDPRTAIAVASDTSIWMRGIHDAVYCVDHQGRVFPSRYSTLADVERKVTAAEFVFEGDSITLTF